MIELKYPAPCLYVLVGNVASGKSTYCREVAGQLGRSNIIVNDDAIVAALHGGITNTYYPNLRALYKSVQREAIVTGLLLGCNVFVDSTNVTVRRRHKLIELARDCGARAGAVVFARLAPQQHAERRFKHDSRGYTLESWLKVAELCESEYEPVTNGEGFRDIVNIPNRPTPEMG